ncbi:MAG: penicillin-binding protein 1A [Gammaproteobacteria bacterium]|nr:penicillin-binding protein 1A [Gammaproteobacteria bacterium]
MANRWTYKKFTLVSIALISVIGFIATAATLAYIVPGLPSVEALKDVQLQVPLRVFSKDGKLIAEFGEKKRAPIKIDDAPKKLIEAILAAEDSRFYVHPGVDYQGLLRAVFQLIRTGEKAQGGSTITMQVARNFFLSREKTYFRKLSEILLALKIERELSKNNILELYLNKMYMGKRAYGVNAAAQVYYGKKIDELTVPQLAMLAGLYKAPSAYNPIINPERAVLRRNYVLGRMHKLGYIDDSQYELAINEGYTAELHSLAVEVKAPYVAEMARAEAIRLYGTDAYTTGYRLFTTIDSEMQIAANNALHKALLAYDLRHGYRGPEAHVSLPDDATVSADATISDDAATIEGEEDKEKIKVWREALEGLNAGGSLYLALVIAAEERNITVYEKTSRQIIPIYWEGLKWARPYINENRTGVAPSVASDIVKVGDIVLIQKMQKKASAENSSPQAWRLSQIPSVEGALVSINPQNGAINAVVGGFEYNRSKFNRVTQAERQPGSNFKPFIYSGALEHGYTPATLINDAPVVFDDPGLEDEWRPENYSGKFFGPTRLRQGLIKSRNLISIRLLRAIGIRTALKHVSKFGFNTQHLPRDLSLALGSGSITPIELATGYAVFANGGYRVKPYLVERIETKEGEILMEATPATVCRECEATLLKATNKKIIYDLNKEFIAYKDELAGPIPFPVPDIIADRAITPQNNYLMTSMMQDVIRSGTARRARQLGRGDIAGKTGTTNDQRDAWFSGFNPNIVATTWIGFDKPKPLGNKETGSAAALPMWIDFMRDALINYPEKNFEQPEGLVTVRIDPDSGLLASANNRNAIFETFREGNAPNRRSDSVPTDNEFDTTANTGEMGETGEEHLF